MSSRLFQVLITCLVASVALGYNAWASAIALLVLFGYHIADKYFHDSFHDDNKKSIEVLKVDFAKLKVKQDHIDLKSAFGGIRG